MGVRFRKSTKIGGTRVTLGAKSVGVSLGGKYGGISLNSRTGARGRVSAPGTGLSYTKSLNSSKAKARSAAGSVAGSASASGYSAQSPADIHAQKRKARLQKKSYRWLLLSFIGTLLVYIPVILHKEDTDLIGLMPLGIVWMMVCMITALVFYIKEKRK